MLSSKYNIILASGSPRRQQFFKDFDIKFEVKIKEIEELYPEDLKAGQITTYLSELKAAAFSGTILENELLITSDTIVWLDNRALGKPKNYAEAFTMLKDLSDKTHEVITSVSFTTSKNRETITEVTKVTFATLTEEEITYYLNKYKPFDKAGSYGIQDWIGLIGISKIEGSYTNVVGLPTDKVYRYLKNLK